MGNLVCNLVRHLVVLVLASAMLAPTVCVGHFNAGQVAHRNQLQMDQPGAHYYSKPQYKATDAARLYAVDKTSGNSLPLMPGLLDETLLNRGSFSFGAKQVAFHRLKVLGNVYVKNVNGRPLHESYLFKSKLSKRESA